MPTASPTKKKKRKLKSKPSSGTELRFSKKYLGALDFQEHNVDEHLDYYKNKDSQHRLEGSDMGAGKTYIALVVARELGMIPFIVCPKNGRKIWKDAAEVVGVEIHGIINYEKLTCGNTEYGCFAKWNLKKEKFAKRHADYLNDVARAGGDKSKFVEPKPPMRDYEDGDCEFTWNLPDNVFVIFDEGHRMKGVDSLASELLIGIVTLAIQMPEDIKSMIVTATAACSPAEMRALGFALGMHKLTDFMLWARQHGCCETRFGGLDYIGGQDLLLELHAELFPAHGSRIKIADLGDRFPETQISADAYDMGEDTVKMRKVFDDMQAELIKWEVQAAGAKHPLTIILRARQHAELLKVPTFVEMIRDGMKDGMSVLCFVNFTDTLIAIAKKLKTDQLYSGINKRDRDLCLKAFQDNDERLLLLNAAAGSELISCHDLSPGGDYPRLSIISPGWSAHKMHQAFGRPHRAGGTSKSLQRVVYAAKTVEEKVCEKVKFKLRNLQTLNDGDYIADHTREFLSKHGLLEAAAEIGTKED